MTLISQLTHRLTLKIFFLSNRRAFSGNHLRSLSMAQKIRTDESILRSVPPPGQFAPLVLLNIPFSQATHRLSAYRKQARKTF